MKKLYIKPQTEVDIMQTESLLAGHSNDVVGSKEQGLVEEESFFNRDTKNIWEAEGEEE